MFHSGADANYTIKSDCYICNSNEGAGQKSQLAHTYTVSVIRNEFLGFFHGASSVYVQYGNVIYVKRRLRYFFVISETCPTVCAVL